jgi:hypothetical protein
MSRYLLLEDVIVQADCPIENRESDRVVLNSGEEIVIFGETPDLFDKTIRYFATNNGWILKVSDEDLKFFKSI